jgi:hypothetical protein
MTADGSNANLSISPPSSSLIDTHIDIAPSARAHAWWVLASRAAPR